MFKNKKAFTLVEILIVVTIIGIMASLVIPRMTGQTEKARVAEAIGILSAMRRGQVAYYNDHGEYYNLGNDISTGAPITDPDRTKWANLGMEPPATQFWRFSATGGPRGDGSVMASRICSPTTRCPANIADGDWVQLDPNGNWTGKNQYAPGGPYAPSK